MHPTLKLIVKKELNKLLAAKLIFLVRHTQWVANLVLVPNKYSDIRLCVDFHNLNRSLKKDYYLVLPKEKNIQKFSSSEMFPLLNGFLGYNQLLVSPND